MTAPQPWYGQIIQHQLQLLGWTQADLANELEHSQKHVSQLLNGRTRMPVDTLERMLSAVGLQLSITVRNPDE